MGGDVFNLLKLPPRAVDNLLDHLNLFHLMNLRLVCKSTKIWVESPSHLQRFVIHVKARKFLRTLHRSSVKWSNLLLACDTHDPTSTSWIRGDEYFQTWSRLSTCLRVLRFTDQRITFTDGLDLILRNCTELTTLELGTLDLQKVILPVTSEILEGVQKWRSLAISYVAWDQEKDLEWFRQILEASKNLHYFRPPFILSSSVYNLYPSLDVDAVEEKLNEITDRYLFEPVKTLLDNHWKLKNLQVENFDLEQLLQNKLLVHCQESGCLIRNVIECFERCLSKQEISLLGNTIGSLLNCGKHLDLGRLHKLETISIEDLESSDTDKKYFAGGGDTLPSLQMISLTLTTAILQSERLAYCLLQQRRPTVTEINLLFQSDLRGSAQASVFRTPVFSNSFPNLTRLKMNGYDGKTEDYHLLWRGFPKLERVHLENCRSLGDPGLIGDDKENPIFLQLKDLKRLSLEYCGDITDLSITSVIAKLPLELLSLAQPKISYTKGLTSLASRDGPLHKSLMVINCMKPSDEDDSCSEETFKIFLSSKTFLNVKKTEILF